MEATDWIACGIVAVLFYPLMSMAEWYLHRYFMHRQGPKWLPMTRYIYLAHSKVHHSQCFQDRFDRDHKLHCNLFNLTLDMPWLALAVVCWPISLASYWAAGLLVVLVWLHHLTWGLVHTEMHVPSRPWLRRLWPYRVMERHHEIHHQRPGYNFCVVCLGADTWMGTLAKRKLTP